MACMTPAPRRHAHLDRRSRGQGVPRKRDRVADDQPPARLPGLRRGRRVPPAGHDGDDRPRLPPLPLHQAHLPQPGSRAVHQPRDEPLHPVLPLRALLQGLCRRQGPRRFGGAQPRLLRPPRGRRARERVRGNLVEVCPTGVFTDKTLKPPLHPQVGPADGARRSACTAPSAATRIPGERYGELRRILNRYNAR